MKSRHCFALLAWTLLPLAAFAEPAKAPIAAPADARAPVPSASYTSVFARYQPAAEQAHPPDHLWRAANKEVEGGGMAHMGHADAAMTPAVEPAKSETMPESTPTPHAHTPAQPQAQPQPPAADPHQGHQMHHQHKGE